jgi:hypothetical protein
MESDFREVRWGCIFKDDLVRVLPAEEQGQADHPNCDLSFAKRATLQAVFYPMADEDCVTVSVTDPNRSAPITGDVAVNGRTEQLAVYYFLKGQVGGRVNVVLNDLRTFRRALQ